MKRFIFHTRRTIEIEGEDDEAKANYRAQAELHDDEEIVSVEEEEIE